jgi:predicted lipase
LHVFKWISSPIDVDGDGNDTIIDSYKYAGIMSNNANKNVKANSFINSIQLHKDWLDATDNYNRDPTITNDVALKAATKKFENELGIHYTHQECWILNSIPAQEIEI